MAIRTCCCAGLLAFTCLIAADGTPGAERLDNERVRVTEVDYQPGVPRPRYTRPTDQVIVFLDECQYRRTDSATGAEEIRHRKAGDVIFHHKGEDAPVLVNTGAKPYRTLVIELK
ncbi:MAG TPA: hypothetical protein VFA04_10075 [Bryobacteraceae bacterium]|jgi:hypothetical protein|nr:hypothetical protein [Bryobacteraceae bacterium]